LRTKAIRFSDAKKVASKKISAQQAGSAINQSEATEEKEGSRQDSGNHKQSTLAENKELKQAHAGHARVLTQRPKGLRQ